MPPDSHFQTDEASVSWFDWYKYHHRSLTYIIIQCAWSHSSLGPGFIRSVKQINHNFLFMPSWWSMRNHGAQQPLRKTCHYASGIAVMRCHTCTKRFNKQYLACTVSVGTMLQRFSPHYRRLSFFCIAFLTLRHIRLTERLKLKHVAWILYRTSSGRGASKIWKKPAKGCINLLSLWCRHGLECQATFWSLCMLSNKRIMYAQ